MRGRPKRGFIDGIKDSMGKMGMEEGTVEDKCRWRRDIHFGYPLIGDELKKREKFSIQG